MNNAPLLIECPDIDTNREHAYVNKPVFHLNTLRKRLRAQDSAHGLPEVSCEVGGLETNQIGTEDAVQEFIADGQATEDLRGREGDVHEETDGSVGQLGADHGWKEHEVVVVHPDDITIVVGSDDSIGKTLVDGDVLLEGT